MNAPVERSSVERAEPRKSGYLGAALGFLCFSITMMGTGYADAQNNELFGAQRMQAFGAGVEACLDYVTRNQSVTSLERSRFKGNQSKMSWSDNAVRPGASQPYYVTVNTKPTRCSIVLVPSNKQTNTLAARHLVGVLRSAGFETNGRFTAFRGLAASNGAANITVRGKARSKNNRVFSGEFTFARKK